jgi:DNA polymerase Ligase (LigD)
VPLSLITAAAPLPKLSRAFTLFMKRANALDVVENPFIKRHNRSWTVGPPASLTARVSPPRSRRSTKIVADDASLRADLIEEADSESELKAKATAETAHGASPTTVAVECGDVGLEDPVSFFSTKLLEAARPELPDVPRLSHGRWLDIYHRNQHPHGRHFVIHQHDHPVAGTHYDLRLQCNATSSISWACMYGLPGDPNSRRLNRNATETRVHNLWVGQLNQNQIILPLLLRISTHLSARIILSKQHHILLALC